MLIPYAAAPTYAAVGPTQRSVAVSRRDATQKGIHKLRASYSISISIITTTIIPLGVESVLREAVTVWGMGLLVMSYSDATSSPTRRR